MGSNNYGTDSQQGTRKYKGVDEKISIKVGEENGR